MKNILLIVLFIPFICQSQGRGYIPLCTQTNTWKAACTNVPAALTVYVINQLIQTSISDSAWNTYDCLQWYAQDDSTNSFRSIVNPASTLAKTMKKPTWTQYQGWHGNASSSYLDTKFNTSTGTNFILASHSFGLGCLSASTGTNYNGIYNSSSVWFINSPYLNSAGGSRVYDGNTTVNNTTATNAKGFFLLNSINGFLYDYFNKNKSTGAAIINSLLNYTILLGTNNGNTPGSLGYNSLVYCFMTVGRGLTYTMEQHEADNFNRAMQQVGHGLY